MRRIDRLVRLLDASDRRTRENSRGQNDVRLRLSSVILTITQIARSIRCQAFYTIFIREYLCTDRRPTYSQMPYFDVKYYALTYAVNRAVMRFLGRAGGIRNGRIIHSLCINGKNAWLRHSQRDENGLFPEKAAVLCSVYAL